MLRVPMGQKAAIPKDVLEFDCVWKRPAVSVAWIIDSRAGCFQPA